MSLFTEFPTKAKLAQLLSDTQIQDAIKKYQPKNAEWASKPRPKSQLVAFVTLKTLLSAAIDMFEEKKDVEKITELKKYFAELEGESLQPSNVIQAISQPSTLSKQKLQEHLAVLIAAGLMTDDIAKEIKSFWDLCARNRKNETSKTVTDNVNAVDFDEETGNIVRLSDGYCYSKSSMLEFLRKGTVDQETGRQVLPLSLQAIKDADYKVLGVSPPNATEIRAARAAQSERSFQQLIAGDFEAWRAGNAPAEPEFELLITNDTDRERLERELAEMQPRARRRVPHTYSNAVNDTPNTTPLTIRPRILPKKAVFSTGKNHSIAIDQNGKLFGWYWDNNADDEFRLTRTPYFSALYNDQFSAVAVGTTHSLGLVTDGTIVGWGHSDYGRIPHMLTEGKKYIAIAAGNAHSLGLLENGTVVGWGGNTYGQATSPSQSLTRGKKIIDIAAGYSHSLAILEDGQVIGWGNNASGQCQAASQGRKFVRIAGGFKHSLGILDNGKVVGWGFDEDGQASTGQSKVDARPLNQREKFIDIAAGHTISVGLLADGTIVYWGSEKNFGTIAPLATGNRVRAISVTPSDITTVMLNDRKLLCWNNNGWFRVHQQLPSLKQV